MSLTKIKRNTYLLILCGFPVLYFLYDYTPFDELPENFKFNKEWHVEPRDYHKDFFRFSVVLNPKSIENISKS